MADETDGSVSRKERCLGWLHTPRVSVYVMKGLSAWGDRMWMFAVGLYLVKLSNVTLTLTAIYGLTGGVCVILLGALVGDWVDKNPRLKVARTSLVIQNSAVILCAVILCVVISYYQQILTIWPVHLANICSALVIGTAIISKLASIATKIAVEKDWVVVMCAGDRDKLSTMNASMRRIDLLCNILAPVLVGQIMTFISMVMGAVVIAGWNLISVFLEYFLLWRIYTAFPALAVKGNQDAEKLKIKEKTIEEAPEAESLIEHSDKPSESGDQSKSHDQSSMSDSEVKGTDQMETSKHENKSGGKSKDFPEAGVQIGAPERIKESASEPDLKAVQKVPGDKPKKTLFQLVFGRFISIYKGWRVYLRQSVLPAGIAFSCEFMTVLAFDNITSGYAYSQRLSESIIGILMAAGAVTGIAGTFVFPILRRRIGLERTGVVAFVTFIGCLSLCVISVWVEGSPFDPTFSKPPQNTSSCSNVQLTTAPIPNPVANLSYENLVKREVSYDTLSSEVSRYLNGLVPSENDNVYKALSFRHRIQRDASPIYRNESGSDLQSSTNCTGLAGKGSWSYTSIGLLMAGIVAARFGLWLSDLTITQVFQENVIETERGVVNGVQSSLNMLMDVIRYAMVVIAPRPETYGILVLISFMSICTGAACFVYYTTKKQGYLCCKRRGHDLNLTGDVELEDKPNHDKSFA